MSPEKAVLLFLLVLAAVAAAIPAGRGGPPAQGELFDAIRHGDASAARVALERGASANAPNGDGTPPLHAAVLADAPAVLRLLAEHGASLEGRDARGATALHFAVLNKRRACVRTLLRLGASADSRDAQGQSVRARMMDETCKGEVVAWDRETLLLLNDPTSPNLAPDTRDPEGDAERFECPMVRASVIADRDFRTNWKSGYRSAPHAKETLEDGSVRLTCRVTIENPGASVRLSAEHDFESCVGGADGWTCGLRDDPLGEVFLPLPKLQAEIVGRSEFRLTTADTFATRTTYRNLQPNGEIYLGVRADLPRPEAELVLSPEHAADACRIAEGRWECTRTW